MTMALTLATTGCSEAAEQPESTKSTPRTPPTGSPAGTEDFYKQRLSWSSCGGGFECAKAEVPLDYTKPTRGRVRISLIRLPAQNKSRRIGSLFTNPGGPGGSGVEFVRQAATSFGKDLRERFDIIGVDPRGVGTSDPVRCMDGPQLDKYFSIDSSPDDQKELDTLAAESEAFAKACQSKSWTMRMRRDRSLLIMVAPAVLLLAVFAYVPMAGNVVAWQDYSPYVGIRESPFVGWANFERVFTNPLFLDAVANTLVITAFQLVFFFPVPIVLALLLNSVLTPSLRTTIQSIVYLPHFFSWVIVVTIFQQIFGGAGMLASRMREAGYSGFDLMTNPDTFLLLITAQSVWKDAGWGIIIFLAALATVDTQLYEASVMDGAGRWRRMWHVTLPAMRPVIILLLILRLGDSLTVGFEQLILQRGAVGTDVAEVLDTFVYYQGVVNGDWAFAAAAGLVKGLVSLALVLGANKLAHLVGEAGVYQRA